MKPIKYLYGLLLKLHEIQKYDLKTNISTYHGHIVTIEKPRWRTVKATIDMRLIIELDAEAMIATVYGADGAEKEIISDTLMEIYKNYEKKIKIQINS